MSCNKERNEDRSEEEMSDEQRNEELITALPRRSSSSLLWIAHQLCV